MVLHGVRPATMRTPGAATPASLIMLAVADRFSPTIGIIFIAMTTGLHLHMLLLIATNRRHFLQFIVFAM